MEDIGDVVARFSKKLAGLTPATSGNLSLRKGERVGVTPSGISYDRLSAEMIPVVSPAGKILAGEKKPTSELPLHLALYENFSCGAVVHTHSPWATTLAVLREPLPPVHYMSVPAGREIPVADYATFGTEELSKKVVHTLQTKGTTACLLANHGLIAFGETLKETFELAESIEFAARVYCQARQLGSPAELNDEQVEKAGRRFEEYGQPEE